MTPRRYFLNDPDRGFLTPDGGFTDTPGKAGMWRGVGALALMDKNPDAGLSAMLAIDEPKNRRAACFFLPLYATLH